MLTVHHLDFSRSTRVVWLLEEVGVPYRLIRYARPVGGRAPDALKAVHPLGKSPVIEDNGLVLAESSAILRYLDLRYAASRFTPSDLRERARHDEWLDSIESSLALSLFAPLAWGPDLSDALRESLRAQLAKAWTFMESSIEGGTYLMGEHLTLADMQMSYVVAVASATGALKPFPQIDAYLRRLMLRPALNRAIAAGGPMA